MARVNSQKEQIKQLLLADELELLQHLRKKMLESEAFSDEVAKVLARATGKAWKNDPAYQSVLAKPIGEGLKTAIKREQRTIIDAFVPVMGPMIRASVSASIKKLMTDINRVLELGLSPRALKWRWQAWKTGVPFAELVFLHTVEYQVQHVFLIDKDSGLLIEYAGHEEKLARDKDAFSAMLTAIGDFVSDTLSEGTIGRWRSAELDEHQLWIIDGPLAYLAVLIKGSPSERLREHLQDALDKIHVLYDDELKNASGFGKVPAVRLELEDLLITRSRQQEEDVAQKKRRWPWLLLAAMLAAGGYSLWQAHQKKQRLNALREQLEQLPGLVVEDVRYTDDGILVTGLQDPEAAVAPFVRQNVHFQTRPYLSLDPMMIQTRAHRLAEPTGLSVTLNDDGTARLSGQAGDTALNELRQRLLAIPGVTKVDASAVVTPQARWRAFVKQHPLPKGVHARFYGKKLTLEGKGRRDEIAAWLQLFSSRFPNAQVQSDSLLQLPDPQTLKTAIENFFVPMPEGTEINGSLQEIVKTLRQWFLLFPTGGIALVGQTDCTGTAEGNRRLAQARADTLKKTLVASGLPTKKLHARISPCANRKTNRPEPSLRGVRFQITPPPKSAP